MTEVTIEIPTCHCGVLMSLNPHPDAGKVETLLEVGATFVCVPCCVKSRHIATEQSIDADAKTRAIKEDIVEMYNDVRRSRGLYLETSSVQSRLHSIRKAWCER